MKIKQTLRTFWRSLPRHIRIKRLVIGRMPAESFGTSSWGWGFKDGVTPVFGYYSSSTEAFYGIGLHFPLKADAIADMLLADEEEMEREKAECTANWAQELDRELEKEQKVFLSENPDRRIPQLTKVKVGRAHARN